MRKKRISMLKIREILRLHHQHGLSMRQISDSVSVGIGTVHRLLRRCTAAELSWAAVVEMNDQELSAALHSHAGAAGAAEVVVPDWQVMEQELSKKGVTRQLLWEEYVCLNGADKSYSYSQFCALYQKWRGQSRITMRQQHRAGEKCFVDYSGMTMPVKIGEQRVRQAQIFVAALGFSSYTYAEASWTQQSADWLASSTRMLEFFGGVPLLIVPDNLKSAVTTACNYDPDKNPLYAQWASHYGTVILPTRINKPQDKAVVESSVLQVQRRLLAPLRKRTFHTLRQLNEALAERLQQLNAKPFQKRPGSRAEQFQQVDQPALRPLPKQPFELLQSRTVKVHPDYHVQFGSHLYSVPYQYVGQKLQLHASAELVRLYYNSQEVASHVRNTDYGYSTLPAHMPRSHFEQARWTPQTLLAQAQRIGPNVTQWVQLLFDSKDHPEQAYRVCMGLFGLVREHSAQRVDRSCQIACQHQMLRLKQLKNILKHKTDLLTREEPCPAPLPQQHANVRGAKYFQ